MVPRRAAPAVAVAVALSAVLFRFRFLSVDAAESAFVPPTFPLFPQESRRRRRRFGLGLASFVAHTRISSSSSSSRASSAPAAFVDEAGGDGEGDDGSSSSSTAATTPTSSSGPRSSSSSSSSTAGSSRRRRSGPRGERSRPAPRSRRRPSASSAAAASTKRAPHQYDHTKDVARPFVDAASEIAGQVPNEDAAPYDLTGDDDENDDDDGGRLKRMSAPRAAAAAAASAEETEERTPPPPGLPITHDHMRFVSLDDLFPSLGFSELFSSSGRFRDELRSAMREDVFDTTPAYASMPPKARRMLLLPDSSLQGSWKCDGGGRRRPRRRNDDDDAEGDDAEGGGGEEEVEKKTKVRMTRLTEVLRTHLGSSSSASSAAPPTGDEFMNAIGALCGSSPTNHWIDIIGVLDRRVSHSWHQDTGTSRGGDTYTVMLGFPPSDDYDGVGVFSHAVKLTREARADDERRPSNEPVVYGGTVEERYIVRPRFARGREILVYRDVDVVHSSPDIAHRASVMRFM